MASNPSDSHVQRVIEKEMLSDLEKLHPDWQKQDWHALIVGREFASKVKPDGVWRDSNGVIIIAECFARIGKLKPGQHRKIASDVLKLIYLKEELSDKNSVCLLMVVPEELGLYFKSDDWLSIIISKKIDLVKIQLSDQQRKQLLDAVSRQGEGQSRTKGERTTP
jgi:hypothetical protein